MRITTTSMNRNSRCCERIDKSGLIVAERYWAVQWCDQDSSIGCVAIQTTWLVTLRMLRKRMFRNNQHALGRGRRKKQPACRHLHTLSAGPITTRTTPSPLPDCLQLWQGPASQLCFFFLLFRSPPCLTAAAAHRKQLWAGNTADSNQSLCLSLSPSMFMQGPDFSASLLLFHTTGSGCCSADRRYAPRFLLIPMLVYKRYG
ncbi:hypothetical protein F5883DRAFT_123795 [Diaporthe sp. PMI_573]|nr:hypothetical protein F5883DRAFT_123795 [Diaporthaceae sp. PMI_573]